MDYLYKNLHDVYYSVSELFLHSTFSLLSTCTYRYRKICLLTRG